MTSITATPTSNQYINGASLQQAFIDIRTGQPLSGGTLTFYKDTDHSDLTGRKNIYVVGGTPEEPTYTPLPNPLTLSLIGTIIDPNNNQEIVPFFYPYDEDGNIELYYVVIKASDGYPQGTRDHFPSVNSSGSDLSIQTENIVPDGQFLLHQDIPASGLITEDETPLAYGGFIFYRTPGTTSVNYVTFDRFDTPIDDPESNPRYACSIRCTSADPTDTRKDLSLIVTDVNFMQGKTVTFQSVAFSKDGSTHNVDLILRKTYGDTFASSPPTEEVLTTFTVTPDEEKFLFSFTVSSNEGKTLADNNSDYLEILLRAPLASVSHISHTNWIWVEGEFFALSYPDVSPEQVKAFAIPASQEAPAYDGSNVGDFIKVGTLSHGQMGFVYAPSVPPGTVIYNIAATIPDEGWLPIDASSYSVEENENNLFAAYPRLFSYILTGSQLGKYSFGTGQNGFRNSSISGTQMRHTWNRMDVAQPVTAYDAGTSGFTFAQGTDGSGFTIVTVTVLAGSGITPGSYYRLTVNTSGAPFTQLFWFTVNGAGSMPAVAYQAAVKIAILSADTQAQVRDKLIKYANGLFQIPPHFSYMRMWNNGSGSDPDASSRTAIGYASSGNSGDNIGSFQSGIVGGHTHTNIHGNAAVFLTENLSGTPSGDGLTNVGVTKFVSNFDSAGTGSVVPATNQTTPANIYLNAFIKT